MAEADGRRADGSYGVLWLTPSADEMKEQDWNFPEGRFLAYVLGPAEPGHVPIFIVLNAAPEATTRSICRFRRKPSSRCASSYRSLAWPARRRGAGAEW